MQELFNKLASFWPPKNQKDSEEDLGSALEPPEDHTTEETALDDGYDEGVVTPETAKPDEELAWTLGGQLKKTECLGSPFAMPPHAAEKQEPEEPDIDAQIRELEQLPSN